MAIQCSACKQPFVRRAHRQGILERLLSLVSVYPFRCEMCTRRFFALQLQRNYDKQLVERRQHSRFATNLPMTFVASRHEGVGRVRVLSVAGCAVKTTSQLLLGTILSMQVELLQTTISLTVEKAVVRSVQDPILGIHFIRMHPTEQERLEQFLHSLWETTSV